MAVVVVRAEWRRTFGLDLLARKQEATIRGRPVAIFAVEGLGLKNTATHMNIRGHPVGIFRCWTCIRPTRWEILTAAEWRSVRQRIKNVTRVIFHVMELDFSVDHIWSVAPCMPGILSDK